MIRRNILQKELAGRNWKAIRGHPDFRSMVEFDIIDEKKSWYLADWFLLVKEFKVFDDKKAAEIVKAFDSIEDQTRGWWKSKVFFVFVLADKVSPSAARKIASNEFDINNLNLNGQAAGRIFVIDTSKCIVYGTLPTTPMDARLKLSHIKDSVEKVLDKPLHYDYSSDPERLSSARRRYMFMVFILGLASFALGFAVAMILIFFRVI